jgi:DNA modification methylase
MVFTDPPYNVNYGATMKDHLRDTHRPIANDNLGEDFAAFLRAACDRMLAACTGGIYICMSSSEIDTLQRVFREAGGHWSTFIIWAKNTFTMGRADYQRQYEPILYGWREGAERFWCGARDQGDVWNIKKPHVNDLHPTMKPVELVERAVRNSSAPGATVLDPFGGSGTTVIACEKAGRQARVIELEPKYCDVNLGKAQLTRCQETPAAGDDPVVGIDEDRVDETELHNGRRDLRHLLWRVRPRVLGVGHEPVDQPDLNAARHDRRNGCLRCWHLLRGPSAQPWHGRGDHLL